MTPSPKTRAIVSALREALEAEISDVLIERCSDALETDGLSPLDIEIASIAALSETLATILSNHPPAIVEAKIGVITGYIRQRVPAMKAFAAAHVHPAPEAQQ
jgi:hypothetical protein